MGSYSPLSYFYSGSVNMNIFFNGFIKIVSLYSVVFITVLSGISYYKVSTVSNGNVGPMTMKNPKPADEIKDQYLEDKTIIADKTIYVDKVKYRLIYEKETKKYLVYKGFNLFLGYLYLGVDESINYIDETNLIEHIDYKK